MACKNFQIGQKNKLILHIEEDSKGISNGADFVDDVVTGANFKFGQFDSDKVAQYTFTFNVE